MRLAACLGLIGMLMLAACKPAGDPGAPAPLPPVGEARIALDRMACEAGGGAFRQREGAGVWVCLRTPRDAGQACRTGTECEGACLARSMTCAPFVPLLGCHEVMTGSGLRVTECVQ
ncbi:hypothetical protein [Pontitalea aquivivens]|uniref:hypothetical protein n=1 Tax=Pontitalea aquivivens TaxID=3388663 RepID=UPI003970C0C9